MGAAASLEGFLEFQAVYDRLKNSELLEYEDKVRSARMKQQKRNSMNSFLQNSGEYEACTI